MTESSSNLSILRPGYREVKAASLLPRDAEAWVPFVRDVLGLPLSMLPGVQQSINRKAWMLARDPLEQVRNAAANWAGRMFRDNAAGNPRAGVEPLLHGPGDRTNSMFAPERN
jgi:hypothetical protein